MFVDDFGFGWSSSKGEIYRSQRYYIGTIVYKDAQGNFDESKADTLTKPMTINELHALWASNEAKSGKASLVNTKFHSERITRRIPYWLILVPLILASAYLLLTKPPSAIRTAANKPANQRGA